MALLRSWKFWLILSALLFAAYCVLLLLFVSGQSKRMNRNIAWSIPTQSWSITGLDLSSDGHVMLTENSGEISVYDANGNKLPKSIAKQGGYGGYTEADSAFLADGSIVMIDQAPASPGFPVVNSSTVRHIAVDGSELAALNVPFDMDVSKGLVALDNCVLLVDSSAQLHCLDMTGKELWQQTPPAGAMQFAGPGGNILILDVNSISNQGELALVDGSGAELWRIPLPGDFGSNFLFDGRFAWYADGSGAIRCLDGTGSEIPTPLSGAGGFDTSGVSALQYGYAYMSFAQQIAGDGSGMLAFIDSSGNVSLLDANGTLLLQNSKLADYGCSIALDSGNERLLISGPQGLSVYDFQGKLRGGNEFVRTGVPVRLDSGHRHLIVSDTNRVVCVEY